MTKLEDEAKQKVIALIDERRGEIIKFLSRLIQFKSINPLNTIPGESNENRACMEWLRSQFEATGCFSKIDFWEEKEDMPNFVGVVKGTGGGRNLMTNAHADVVRVTDEHLKTWTAPPPWKGEVKDGRVWGRGAIDDKSGCAITFWATKLLHDAGVRLKGDVLVTIVSAEEIAARELGPFAIVERGYMAPFLMVAEASDLEIRNMAKGLFYFRLTVPGKSVHNSQREKCIYPRPYGLEPVGVNAIEKMLKFMTAFRDLEEQWGLYNKHPHVPPGSMHIGPTIIKGGEYKAAIPDSCEVVYGVYFIMGFRGAQVLDEVKGIVDRVVEGDYWLRENPPKFESPVIEPLFEPFETARDHPGCKTLAKAIKEVTGKEAEFGMSSVGDFNWFAEKELPVVVFGPEGGGVHGTDEYVTIDTLIDACKIYASMMIDWCGVSEIK